MRSSLIATILASVVIFSSCTSPEIDYRDSYIGSWNIEYSYEHTYQDSILDESLNQFEGDVYVDASDPEYAIRIETAPGEPETYYLDLQGVMAIHNSQDYRSSRGSFFDIDNFFIRSYYTDENGHEKWAWEHSGERVTRAN